MLVLDRHRVLIRFNCMSFIRRHRGRTSGAEQRPGVAVVACENIHRRTATVDGNK